MRFVLGLKLDGRSVIMRSPGLWIMLLLISTARMFSQGEYLYKGESGFGAAFSITSANHTASMEMSAGYCWKGIADVVIGYGGANLDYRSTGSSVSPSIAIYLSKQEREKSTPTVGIVFTYTSITYPPSKYAGTSQESGEAFSVGVATAHEATHSASFIVQPMVEVGYTSAREDGLRTNGMTMAGSLAMGPRLKGGGIIAVAPAVGWVVGYKERTVAYGVSLALVF